MGLLLYRKLMMTPYIGFSLSENVSFKCSPCWLVYTYAYDNFLEYSWCVLFCCMKYVYGIFKETVCLISNASYAHFEYIRYVVNMFIIFDGKSFSPFDLCTSQGILGMKVRILSYY
jgi:hypothetical protein